MGSQRKTTDRSFTNKRELVGYANEMLQTLPPTSPWTTIITRGRYGGYSVRTVTGELSEDTEGRQEVLKFSDEHHNT